MKIKITIKSWFNGEVLFEFEKENNTIKDTVLEAIKNKANLRSADLRSADLRSADLRSADLRSADLRSADLRYANLRSADLRSADLRSANLCSADLSFADLRYANLSFADLSFANLSFADLSYANLRSADLRSADLRYADLRSADLRYAVTDKRYIQIGCIGSRKGQTIYCFEDDIVWCGCWKGTLKEFEKKCKETHKDNKQYLNEYLGFIKYIKSLK